MIATAHPGRPIVYMTMTYSPYSVPIFDALHERLGERFLVLSREPTEPDSPGGKLHNYQAATRLGAFPRRYVRNHKVPVRLERANGETRIARMGIAPSLPRILRALDPAFVVSPNFSTWTLSSLLAGCPTAIFWEGWAHTERSVGAPRLTLRRWMARRATSLIAQGQLARAYLRDTLGVPEPRIHMPGLCAFPAPADLRDRARTRRRSLQRIRFLSVARLVRGKGIDHLIRATALVEAATAGRTPYEVVVIGEGPDRDRLQRLIDDNGLRHRVRLPGYVPSSDIWQEYAAADVFVLPTLQDNWPLSVAEAMSMGLPVLLSHCAGSAADLVEPGGNGATFDPSDPPALSRHMLEYVRQPGAVPLHGERSLELIAAYEPGRVADSILNALGLHRGPAHSTDSRIMALRTHLHTAGISPAGASFQE